MKQCSLLLNRDRNTLQKWLDQGCPFVTQADRNLGIAWELDVSEVVKWLEERAAKSAAEKFGDSEDGKLSEDEAKRRRAVAQAVVAGRSPGSPSLFTGNLCRRPSCRTRQAGRRAPGCRPRAGEDQW